MIKSHHTWLVLACFKVGWNKMRVSAMAVVGLTHWFSSGWVSVGPLPKTRLRVWNEMRVSGVTSLLQWFRWLSDYQFWVSGWYVWRVIAYNTSFFLLWNVNEGFGHSLIALSKLNFYSDHSWVALYAIAHCVFWDGQVWIIFKTCPFSLPATWFKWRDYDDKCMLQLCISEVHIYSSESALRNVL